MRRLFVFTLLLPLLAACAPATAPSASASRSGPDHYWLSVLPINQGSATVAYTIPAEFPQASKEVRATLSCRTRTWSKPLTATEGIDLFISYARSNPVFHLEDDAIAVKGYRISCEGDAIKLKGPDFPSAIGLIRTSPTRSIGADYRGDLVFRAFYRYRYPNLRLEPYWSEVLVTLAPDTVSARRSSLFYSGDAVVGLRQAGETKPVFFQGSGTTVTYEPMQEATLYVSRGRDADIHPMWDVVNFNYSEGWLTWQLTSDPPPTN